MDDSSIDRAPDTSDRALLEQLRGGDPTAYTELWRRHVAAALTLARRIAPAHAEDLVSDSFLAVYHQVTVAGGGPASSFRAYLFTVMRNTAMRWQRESERLRPVEVENLEELSAQSDEDALGLLTREHTSAELLAAMKSLPERWQRVLWLTEVEDASRGQIARELGIGANAVSQLQRRARSGLRMNWLNQQIPASLRDEQAHVANLLPRLIVDGRANGISKKVNAHLRACEQCADINSELRSSYAQLRKVTLSLAGFAALAGTVPAMAPLATVGTAAGIASASVLGAAVVASIGLVFASGAVQLGQHSPGSGSTPPGTSTSQEGAVDRENGNTSQGSGENKPDQDPHAPIETSTVLGRNNADHSITSVTFVENNYVPPARTPRYLPGQGPAQGSASAPNIQLTSAPAASSYLAPTISGTSTPGAEVLVEVTRPVIYEGQTTTPEVFAANVRSDGSWQFRFQDLLFETPGVYHYRVWAHTDQADSAPLPSTFTLASPEVSGLEFSAPYDPLPIAEASTTGVVFRVAGPASSTVCLDSAYTGQVAHIALDQHGQAIQRLRIPEAGSYFLVFRVCEGEYRSPGFEVFVDVEDPNGPIFGNYGPGSALLEVSNA